MADLCIRAIIGANSVIIKHHVHAAARLGTGLGGMLLRVALADEMVQSSGPG